MAMAIVFRSCCNGDGDGATAAIDCNCNGTGAMAMGRRGVGSNGYVLFCGSMSCIVVAENVQNVWTAIIREVVPAIKTGPF
jgi:hypothetical protein